MKRLKITMTSIVALVTVLGLSGCGGGNSSAVTSGNPQNGGNQNPNTPSTLYTAFSPLVATRADVLYKTNGIATGTSEVSNIMVPADSTSNSDFRYEKIDTFNIYGNYLYFQRRTKYIDSISILPILSQGTYSTKLSDGSTSDLSMPTDPHTIGVIHGDSIKRVEVNGALYTISGTVNNYGIDKILSDGTRTSIDLSSISPSAPYLLGSMASVGNDIYFLTSDSSNVVAPTNTKLVKLGTDTGSLDANIATLQNMQIVKMTSRGTKLILLGDVSGTAGLYSYETTTPAIPAVLLDSSVTFGAKEFVEFNGDLYLISGPNAITLYKIDLANNNTQVISTSADEIGYKGSLIYNNRLYFISDHRLFSLSSTANQVSMITNTLVNSTANEDAAVVANGKLYFSCNINTNGLNDMELCQYDGTSVTTAENINGSGSSYPTQFSNLDGELIFQASPDGTNNKLYHYDGTTLTVLN